MHDLRPHLQDLWKTLSRLSSGRGGRVIQFVGATDAEGATSVAASFAAIAAEHCTRATWAIDLDFDSLDLWNGLSSEVIPDLGPPGRAYDASLRHDPPYDLIGIDDTPDNLKKLLALHRLGKSRLMVTHFRKERVPEDYQVAIADAPEWWAAVRASADWTIVDTPSLARSSTGLDISAHVDGVVLVARADQHTAKDLALIRRDLERSGANILGVVMNQMRGDARLIGRAFG